MNSKDQNDQQLQDYLQGKDAISGQYCGLADQTPPAHIDAAILAASRKAVGAGPQPGTTGLSGRWHVPVSIAAVIMLSVLVVFNIPDQQIRSSYAPLPDRDNAGVSMEQSAAEVHVDGSGSGTTVGDRAADYNSGPVPQLSESVSSDIAQAADNAVVPRLEMAGSAAAPPVTSDQAFAAETAAAITPEFQRESANIEARGRVLQRAMEPRQENAMSAQVTAQPTTADLLGTSEPSALTECTNPRPEICTFEYLPVCAVRDTGIRCVTTPCDSTELVQYGNACAACSDPDVIGYTDGICE